MKFSEEHLWMLEDDETVVIGVTAFGVGELGEVVFVDLPEVGVPVAADEEIAVVESAKTAVDILAPIDGEVVEVNERLRDDPGHLNSDPEGEGWLFKVEPDNFDDLSDYMEESEYKSFIS